MSPEPKLPLNKYRNISELFAQAEEQYRDKTALICHSVKMSYGDVAMKAQYLAQYLMHELQIEKGDRIAVLLPNSMQFIISVSAILRIGAVVVNINPLYTPTEVQAVLADARPRAVIYLDHLSAGLDGCDPSWAPQFFIETSVADCYPWYKRLAIGFYLRYIQKRIPKDISIPTQKYRWRAMIKPHKGIHHCRLDIMPEDLAFLQYTGGTSSQKPKAAMLTHANIIANILQCRHWLLQYEASPESLMVGTFLPLYHIFALTANFLVFYALGATNVLFMNPRDLPAVFKEWKKHPLDALAGVNTLFSGYMKAHDFDTLPLKKLRIVLGGGMTVQEHVASEWLQRTGCPITQAYGLTEASPAVCLNPLTSEPFDGTVGYPLPLTELRFCDDGGGDVAQGEPGELWVKGPQVMRGYWEQPETTADVLTPDGWLKTGDIAVLEPSGKVRLVDRKKDIIIISGFNVYPCEVEGVLLRHPSIKEVAVVSLKQEDGLEHVGAFCVMKEGALFDKQGLLAHSQQHLAAYKVPKHFYCVPEIPKSHVGKVLKKDLIAALPEIIAASNNKSED